MVKHLIVICHCFPRMTIGDAASSYWILGPISIYGRVESLGNGPLTRYVKLRAAHAPGMPRMFFPTRRLQRKPLVSDPGMHHGTCVTHVLWCMSGSLICGGGENVPDIPGACAPAILRIWQEAHGRIRYTWEFSAWMRPLSAIYIKRTMKFCAWISMAGVFLQSVN